MVSDYIVDIFLSSLDGCLYRCQVKNNNFIFFIIATTNIQAQIAKIGKNSLTLTLTIDLSIIIVSMWWKNGSGFQRFSLTIYI